MTLCIYYRKYGTTNWFRVDRYILHESLPSGSDAEANQLYQFDMSFFDPLDSDDNYLIMSNGDDIVITETPDRLNVLDNIKAGCIFQSKRQPIGLDTSTDPYRLPLKFDLTIEQRDFSKIPFKLSALSFDDNSMYQNLSTVLNYIFQPDYVRDDLGGVKQNGVIIPKYTLLSSDIEVQIPETMEGITREFLNEILNPIGYKWAVVYYVEQHTTNTLNLIQSIEIW